MDTQKPQSSLNPNRSWYDKKRFVLPLLIFMFPVGLYALWKGSSFSKGIKIGISAVYVLFFLMYTGAVLFVINNPNNQVVDNNLPDRVDMVVEEITTNGKGESIQFNDDGNEIRRVSAKEADGIKITRKQLLQNEVGDYFKLEQLEEKNSYGAMAGNVVMKIEGVDGNYSLIQLNLFVVPDDQNVGPAVTTAIFKNLLGDKKGEKEANKLFVAFANQEQIKMKEYENFILNVDAKKTEDNKAFVILDFLPKNSNKNENGISKSNDSSEGMTDLERGRYIQENPKTKWAFNLIQGTKWDFEKIQRKLGKYEMIPVTSYNPNIIEAYYFPEAKTTLFRNSLKNELAFIRFGRASE
ncbi:hypothetical protein WAF17_16715 [Bernardetia sp. ABR2-2B]|uniref:hypothetical protein n=1 Tax=Bernardetia sp. ABR2-2B TaxID=3127472 RepID=UPI0030D136F1